MAGDAVNPSLGAWPRHPCRGLIWPPAIPTRPASDTFRRFRPPRKEKRRSKAKAAFQVTPAPLRSNRSYPRMAWIYRVAQGRHLPEIAIYPPSPGNCRRWGGVGWQDRWRHGWRHRAPRDGFTACPANPHRPAQPVETQSRFGFGFGLCGCRAQPCKEKGRLSAAFTSHYFSLISRRRSSRKPWAVIGSGYRLGFSGVMHDGSTSIRKSGFGCRKNGTE